MILHRCRVFDDRWFHAARSSTYHTFDAILGHIIVLDEIYRSWWSCVLIPICETCAETLIYSLFLRWFLGGASQELPRQTYTSRHLDAITLSFRETPLWSMRLIQLWTWMTWIAHSMTDDLSSSDFPTYHIWMPHWSVFPILFEICRSPTDLHDQDSCPIHVFWYSHDSWTELSQARGFPLHPFSGVHVRSFVRPHGVILKLSR